MLQDLRFACRTFAKNPGFAVLAVLVLAIGIGANSAMFTIVNAVMFKPLSGEAGSLVGIFNFNRDERQYRSFSYPNYADIRAQTADVFDGLVAHTFAMVGVSGGESTRRVFVSVGSSNYFDTMNVPLAIGRTFTAEEERPGARIPVAIVSYERWRQAGFDPALLGRTIQINSIDFTIVGVAPRRFSGTMAMVAPEMWLPLGMFDQVVNDMFKNRGTGLADRGNAGLNLAARLKPGVSQAVAAERLAVIARDLERLYPADNPALDLSVHDLARMTTSTSPQDNSGPAAGSAMLMALSGVVLIIACLNIANMLLARGTSRRKEIAIRMAVGGARRRVMRQLLTESLLLAALGAAGGLVLAFWTNRVLFGSLTAVLPLTLTFDPEPDVNVVIATALMTMLATVLFGIGPALRSSRIDVVDDLKGSGSSAVGGARARRFSARNVLVVSQVALSLALLCTGGLFARGALAAAASDPGFSYRGLLVANLDPTMAGYETARTVALQRAAIERLRALPGVAAASFVSTVPFGEFHEGMPVEPAAAPPATRERRSPTYRIIGADYFRTLGLGMLRGREFTRAEEESATAPRVAIVDHLLAQRLFGGADPIGQTIRVVRQGREAGSGNDGEPMEIVGIAPAIRDTLFAQAPEPHLYVPLGRHYRGSLYLHVRSRDESVDGEASVLAAMRRELNQLDGRLPVLDLMSMATFHARSIELWAIRAGGGLVISMGAVALLLAVVGVYGVKSYVVSQRTREFGIRVAVGARPRDVSWMVLREGLALTGTGVAIGMVLAALAGLGLSRLLYQVSPLDPVVFLLAPLLLAAAATVASWVPARRATRVAPVTALRTE